MFHETPALSPTMASRKLQALAFIELYFGQHGEGPSLGEISAKIGCTPQRAHYLVRTLAREGRIHRTPGERRSIRPLTPQEEEARLGRLTGRPLTNTELPPPPDLDHIPRSHGTKTQASESGGRTAH